MAQFSNQNGLDFESLLRHWAGLRINLASRSAQNRFSADCYGVLGIRIGDHEYFIYAINYDLKMLKIRAERGRDGTRYVLNPAFWPTFGIEDGAVTALAADHHQDGSL
jgi:hypothetical protein